MNVSLAILDKMSKYVAGLINLESFRDWQVDQALNIAALEPDDKQFLAAFEAHYAELSDNLISEKQFMQLLSSLLTPVQAGTLQAKPPELVFYGTTPPVDRKKVLTKSLYTTGSVPFVLVVPEYSSV